MNERACIVCQQPAFVDVITMVEDQRQTMWSACDAHVGVSFEYVNNERRAGKLLRHALSQRGTLHDQ